MLSELYQEKLVTVDEVEIMEGEGGNLAEKDVHVRCFNPLQFMTRGDDVFHTSGHTESTNKLRVLDELFAEDLLTAEECSALARQWREERDRNLSEISPPPELSGGSLRPTLGKRGLYTKDHVTKWTSALVIVLCIKPAEEATSVADILDKFGHDKEAGKLRELNDLFAEGILSADDCSQDARRWRKEWEKQNAQQTYWGLEFGHCAKDLQVTKQRNTVALLCIKTPEKASKGAEILNKHGDNEEARKLRVLNKFFTRQFLTEEDCFEVARLEGWKWKNHVAQVILAKPAKIVLEASQVLEEHGCLVKAELKMLSELYQKNLITADELDGVAANSWTGSSQDVKEAILSLEVYDHPDHLRLFREYASRNAAGKVRAVLEGVGLDSAAITACITSHPKDDEGAVQDGLTRWKEGQGQQPPSWAVLIEAMEYAKIPKQQIQSLKERLDLLGK